MKMVLLNKNGNFVSICIAKIKTNCATIPYDTYFGVDEMEEIKGKQNLKRKLEYIFSRIAVKKAVTYITNSTAYKSIKVIKGVLWHPVVISNSTSNISVSISHCDNYAVALAFSEVFPCGIDIEIINIKNIKVIQRVITIKEMEIINELDCLESNKYTILWTAKEAMSKVIKTGMTCGFELFEIKNIFVKDDIYYGFYKNFAQYMFISKKIDNCILSIVCPKLDEKLFQVIKIEPAEI